MPHPWIIADDTLLRLMTARIVEYRIERRARMALELKRIKGDALTARANIEKLGKLYAKLAQSSGEHASDVEDIVGDVGEMVDDLGAIIDLTKNSVASSNAGTTQGSQQSPPVSQNPPPAVQQGDAPPANPAPPQAAPGVAAESHFPGQV